MTKRERLIAALHNQEVDQLPWAPLIDQYFISSLKEQGLDMDILEAMRYIGNDMMERHVATPQYTYSNVEVTYDQRGDITRTTFQTPVGSIFCEDKRTKSTWFKTKHEIETIEDIRVYQYIVEHTKVKHRIEAFLEREQAIGNDGIATTSGVMCPIQQTLQMLAGVENTVYLMADYPDEMDELFQVMHERNKKEYEVLCEYPTPVIFAYEDTSTTVMSKNMYINYAAPMINDYADIVHRSGKRYITHMCGKLSGFIKEIGSGKMDGIDSVCPSPTGDLNCWDARAAWGTKKVIIGGIEPPSLTRMNVLETLHMVAEIIEKMSGDGFILSTGDAVPFGTPINNLKAVTELIDMLGADALHGSVDQELIAHVASKYQ